MFYGSTASETKREYWQGDVAFRNRTESMAMSAGRKARSSNLQAQRDGWDSYVRGHTENSQQARFLRMTPFLDGRAADRAQANAAKAVRDAFRWADNH